MRKVLRMKRKSNVSIKLFNIRKSIKFRLIVWFVIFATIPMLVVNTVSTGRFTNTVEQTTTTLTTQIVDQIGYSLDFFINDVEKNISKLILNNINHNSAENLIHNYYNGKDATKKNSSVMRIKDEIFGFLTLEKNIIDATIIEADGRFLGNIKGVPEEIAKTISDMEIEQDGIWYTDEKHNKYYAIPVQNSVTGKERVYFVAQVDVQELEKNISEIELFEGANIYIYDNQDNIICSSSESTDSSIVKQVLDEANGSTDNNAISKIIDDMLVSYVRVQNGWTVIVEIPKSQLISSVKEVNFIVWALVVVIAFLAIFAGYLVSKTFTSVIIELVNKMKSAEKGDLTVEVKTKGEDEIQMLGVSFNNMIAQIRLLTQAMKNAINTTLHNGEILGDRTKDSVTAFDQLATSISGITEGSIKQKKDVSDTEIAMGRLADSIHKVRENTQSVFENTKGAKSLVKDATQNIENLNHTMGSSIKISEEINQGIIELSNLTRNIEKIMGIVEGISEETHLLALNASIEASRVGEFGIGFAVIAKEVRKLAEECKKSTVDVKSTLDSISAQTTHTVELVAKSSEIFGQQEKAVENTYKGFKGITNALNDIDDELEVVNSQTIEMEELKTNMQEVIESITCVTEENALATQSVNELSGNQKNVMKELGDMASELNSIMKCLEESIRYFNI